MAAAQAQPTVPALTPSDVVGAITRGCQEIVHHLNSNGSDAVHGPAVTATLEHLMQLAAVLPAPKAQEKKAA